MKQHPLTTSDSSPAKAGLAAETDHADILDGLEDLRARNAGWLSSLSLTPTERKTIALFEAKQLEAISSTLDGRNSAIKAIAENQANLMEKVVDFLVRRTVSTIHVDLAEHITAEAIRLRKCLDDHNRAFYQQITRTLEDAASFPAPLAKKLEDDAMAALGRWTELTARLQEEFADRTKTV